MAVLAAVSNLLPDAFGQCYPYNCGERISNQAIQATIEWDFGNIPGQYHVYRKTSASGSATLEAVLEKTQKTFVTKMPTGSGKEYRYFYVPVELTPTGAVKTRWASSEEILILRKAATRTPMRSRKL